MRNHGFLCCALCDAVEVKRGPLQRYCRKCSEARDLERKARWARENGKPKTSEQLHAEYVGRRAAAKHIGIERGHRASMAPGPPAPNLAWLVRIAVPFTYRMSKNAVWAMAPRGHVYLREAARGARNALAMELKTAMRSQSVVTNKLWIDIHAEKPNHKGDAVNVVDTVCDAIKEAVPLDDRWYCIRSLDWSVSKDNPRLIIGLGQEVGAVDSQVCALCGAIRPLDAFGKNRSTKSGHGRECLECKRAVNQRLRAARHDDKTNPRVEVNVTAWEEQR